MFGPFFWTQQLDRIFTWGVKNHMSFTVTCLYLIPELTWRPRGWTRWEFPGFLGKHTKPFPYFLSQSVATPPAGQHGKFQLEMVTSHKAVKTKPRNAEGRERVHWPAVFCSLKELLFHFRNTVLYPSSRSAGLCTPSRCLLFAKIQLFCITFTSDSDLHSSTRKHPFVNNSTSLVAYPSPIS